MMRFVAILGCWIFSQILIWTVFLLVVEPLFPNTFATHGGEGFWLTIVVNFLFPLFLILVWEKKFYSTASSNDVNN